MLLKKQCPDYLITVVASFLNERSAIFNDGDFAYKHKVSIGCPQGSILSPFLWNILLDDTIREVFPFQHEIIAYADDLTLAAKDPDPEIATKNLESMSNIIITSLNKILLQVNKCAKNHFHDFQSYKVDPS